MFCAHNLPLPHFYRSKVSATNGQRFCPAKRRALALPIPRSDFFRVPTSFLAHSDRLPGKVGLTDAPSTSQIVFGEEKPIFYQHRAHVFRRDVRYRCEMRRQSRLSRRLENEAIKGKLAPLGPRHHHVANRPTINGDRARVGRGQLDALRRRPGERIEGGDERGSPR